ncbi:uncharacterized protein CDV56_107610 [Aspergillus thermomutatus]|uniref:C2H2-type domain-containing protein n=1 Tax=Aspergillus thermomutatus TaxID=41047 RepID=A0A397GX58_ASPTH|nr:uncharacterized protein CDV56_107610 [Aspergillus thermomutatus]RHZ54899.1 hypothetical protein CDV56_107610 [Aspergillus thermomutatus]
MSAPVNRKEKPFSCSYCDATFTRKDVIKRHEFRYHQDVLGAVGATAAASLPLSLQSGSPRNIGPQKHLGREIAASVPSYSQGENPADLDLGIHGGQAQDLFMDCYVIDAFFPSLNPLPMPGKSYTDSLSSRISRSSHCLACPPLASSSWRGSFEFSETKRDQVYTETKDAIGVAGARPISDFPSCLRFERYIVTFFECFLDYLPFIHVPTWQSEKAPPCLLLAMAAIGAACHEEHDTAHAICQAARGSVSRYLEANRMSWDHPVWVTQALLITMSYCVRSGDPELFRWALSYASCLANIIQYSPSLSQYCAVDNDVSEPWDIWIAQETIVRTRWAGYISLQVLSVCFDVAPALSSREFKDLRLPCNESTWTSATSGLWLKEGTDGCEGVLCLGTALDAVLSPSLLQGNTISVFGASVLLHVIVENIWSLKRNALLDPTHVTSCLQKACGALESWRACWEGNVESSVSPRNPHNAVTANPAALLRLGYMWLGADFSSVRAAVVSHDPGKIAQRFKQLVIPMSRSDFTLKIATHAIGALKMRVKLGMSFEKLRLGCFQSFEVHMFSLECCLFSSAWMKEMQNLPEPERTPDESQQIQLLQSILSEVGLSDVHNYKPDSVRLVYAWALILERRSVWKLQAIVADALFQASAVEFYHIDSVIQVSKFPAMSSSTSVHAQKLIRLPPASGLRDLQPVPVYDVTKFPDTRTQKLRSLLEQGHVTVAPLRDPELILHSHLPHLLGSAYTLGANSDQLTRTYEHEITQLVPIARGFIRGEAISKENWRDFLTRKEYTVAYQEFFDKEVEKKQGDWGKVLEEYLYSGPAPLVNGYTGGLGHPFIHLAYAYEFRSKEVATQALSQGCTEYNPLHTFLDQAPPDSSKYKTTSLAEIFEKVRQDGRLEGLFNEPGINNLELLSQEQNLALEECCDLAVLLALSNGNSRDSFDFFNVHIMTVAHALRVLWHYFPPDRRVSILKQYALFGIMTYICQLRPRFSLDWIEAVKLDGRDWNWVLDTALVHKWALDAHFFKVARGPKVFEETFGRKDDFYLKAAIKYVTEFCGWEGYGQGVAGFIPSRDGYRPE